MSQTALQRAVEIAGGQSALARAISSDGAEVKQGHVWHWLNKAARVPAEYVLRIQAATGVPAHELRPDIYPSPPSGGGGARFAAPAAEAAASEA